MSIWSRFSAFKFTFAVQIFFYWLNNFVRLASYSFAAARSLTEWLLPGQTYFSSVYRSLPFQLLIVCRWFFIRLLIRFLFNTSRYNVQVVFHLFISSPSANAWFAPGWLAFPITQRAAAARSLCLSRASSAYCPADKQTDKQTDRIILTTRFILSIFVFIAQYFCSIIRTYRVSAESWEAYKSTFTIELLLNSLCHTFKISV